MSTEADNIAEQTAAVATISGHLFRASLIAKRMALAAKNSRAMVLRAGEKAAGLKVISDYFGELANKTITLSDVINQYAIAISQNSVRQWRTNAFLHRLIQTQTKMEATNINQLSFAFGEGQAQLDHLTQKMHKQLLSLNEQLMDIRQYMQSSSVVAVTFRLEATKTGEFQPMLEHMANTIEQLTNEIKEHIAFSQNQLAKFKVA
ncbi:MAG: hypothetical protein JXR04_06685 [Bermanella sp.]